MLPIYLFKVQYTTAGCNIDYGDCLKFNKDFPNADFEAPHPFLLRVDNGKQCDEGGAYNILDCNYDGGGDCIHFNEQYYQDYKVDTIHHT